MKRQIKYDLGENPLKKKPDFSRPTTRCNPEPKMEFTTFKNLN
jgi:hypothetical protein